MNNKIPNNFQSLFFKPACVDFVYIFLIVGKLLSEPHKMATPQERQDVYSGY